MTHRQPLQTGQTLRHDGSSGIGEGTSPYPSEFSDVPASRERAVAGRRSPVMERRADQSSGHAETGKRDTTARHPH